MNSQNKKQIKLLLFTLVAVLTLGIGYASINAINLIISGNAIASVNDNNFKVFYASLEMSADLLFAKLLGMYIFENYGIELLVSGKQL